MKNILKLNFILDKSQNFEERTNNSFANTIQSSNSPSFESPKTSPDEPKHETPSLENYSTTTASVKNIETSSPEEDLLALKSNIQKQLKEKLFDCDKFSNLIEIAGFSDGSVTESDPNEEDIELDETRNKTLKLTSRSSTSAASLVDSSVSSNNEEQISKKVSDSLQKSSSGDLAKTKGKTNKFHLLN